MTLNELAKKAHENAVKKGFWDCKTSIYHFIMLAITEIAEAVEADRNAKYANLSEVKEETSFDPRTFNKNNRYFKETFVKYIKNTVEDELADVAIRLADLSGSLGIEFEDEDARPIDFFGTASFTENAYDLTNLLTNSNFGTEMKIKTAFKFLFGWAISLNINLWYHIKKKMEYNELRGVLHGKRY